MTSPQIIIPPEIAQLELPPEVKEVRVYEFCRRNVNGLEDVFSYTDQRNIEIEYHFHPGQLTGEFDFYKLYNSFARISGKDVPNNFDDKPSLSIGDKVYDTSIRSCQRNETQINYEYTVLRNKSITPEEFLPFFRNILAVNIALKQELERVEESYGHSYEIYKLIQERITEILTRLEQEVQQISARHSQENGNVRKKSAEMITDLFNQYLRS